MSCTGLTVMIPLYLDAVKSAMKLAEKAISDIHYREVDSVWYYKRRIMLEPGSDLCHRVFLGHHATLAGGHSRYQAINIHCRESSNHSGGQVSRLMSSKLLENVMFVSIINMRMYYLLVSCNHCLY